MIDALVWQEHEEWLQRHASRCVEWHRWTDADWHAAQLAADAAWDQHRSALYVYDAELALREQHYRRTAAMLANEARLDIGWIVGLLERAVP